MATNWITPDINSLNAVLASVALNAADEKLLNAAQRSTKALTFEVARIRDAIQQAGVSPLSLTLTSIPPVAEKHAAVLAAQTLVSSVPQLASYVVSAPGGGKTGLARMIEEAEAWLARVAKGLPVLPPTDPCGQDYINAVSTTNPAIEAIKWGDAYGNSDDYANGFVTNPDGTTSTLLPLDLNTHV